MRRVCVAIRRKLEEKVRYYVEESDEHVDTETLENLLKDETTLLTDFALCLIMEEGVEAKLKEVMK